MMKKRIQILMLTGLLVVLGGCAAKPPAKDGQTSAKEQTDLQTAFSEKEQKEFLAAETDFSVKLFQKSLKGDKSVMVSPVSVLSALAMTANGADGSTADEMLQTIAGGQSAEQLNNGMHWWKEQLVLAQKAKLSLANSIWLREELGLDGLKKAFIQTNQNYYQAELFEADFNSPDTVKDINHWVSDATDGMIDEIVKEVPANAMLYLINGAVFDAEWAKPYGVADLSEDLFYTEDGRKQKAELMYSEEWQYLEGEQVTGFIKPYAEGYSFAALLPEEGVKTADYINSLDGEKFRTLLADASDQRVECWMPKFTGESEMLLNDVLAEMGMRDAFTNTADFSKMTEKASLYIDEVFHKTYIAVDEKGTKAGAVTSVAVKETGLREDGEPKKVRLDRPFIYAIIDDGTQLPVFIGTVMSVET